VDVEEVMRVITPRTRALLVVNPNNPTGSYVSAAELDALRDVCGSRGVALIGDEVFADYPLDAAERTSVLDSDRVLTFGLGGVSKSIGLPQVKLGWVGVKGPAEGIRRALERLEVVCDAYLSVGTPVQRGAASLLERGALIRRQIQDRVTSNLASLRRVAARHGSVEVLPCEAGWSAVLRVPRIATEDELVTRLLGEHHVLVHPGYFFDFPDEAYLVISLLPRSAMFDPAIERVFTVAACG
jgi:alanine-synthesizing transaminase